MTVPQLDVLYPLSPRTVDDVLPFARLVVQGSAGRLWFGQSMLSDAAQVAAVLAGRGMAVPIGTAVSLMLFRHPFAAAAEARSLAMLTGQDVVAGFGVGAPEAAESFTGRRLEDPVGYARAYASAVRDLLDDRVVDRQDDPWPMLCRLLPWSTGGLASDRRSPGERVEVALAALRPRMAQAAGELADAVVTWLTPPGYLADVLVPAVERGRAMGRRPRACRVTCVVHLALHRRGRDVRQLLSAGAQTHLSSPTYAGMLRRAGLDVRENDPQAAVTALIDSGTVAAGTLDEVIHGLRRYAAAGAGVVVLDTSGVLRRHGPEAAADDVREVLAALEAERLPGSSTDPGRQIQDNRARAGAAAG